MTHEPNAPRDAEDQAWKLLDQAKGIEPGNDFNQKVFQRLLRSRKRILHWAIPAAAAMISLVGILLYPYVHSSRHAAPLSVQTNDIPVAENMELLDNLELLENLDSLKDPDTDALMALLPRKKRGARQ